jgi:bla regulator protein BlaR1
MTGPLIAWGVEALIASSLLMLLVLAVRAPVRRAFGAQVAYALWAIPAARLMLPPLPQGWHGDSLPVLPAAEPIAHYLATPAAALPMVQGAADGIDGPAILLALWLAGAGAFLLWQVTDYRRFRRRVMEGSVALERVGAITVVESAGASGPLAFGIRRRIVAFPRDFASRFEADERKLALMHELGHHARGDLAANWAALGVLALHWFNPVAWFAFRAFRTDQEMANDAGVVARLGGAARHAYGCAIVKAAHGRAIGAACHLHNVRDLKGRLRMLGRKRISRTRALLGGGAVLAVALGALAATASGTAAAADVRGAVEEATGVDMDALRLPPPPPAPPAPPAPAAHQTTRVVVREDGRVRRYEGAQAEAYLAAHPAPVPPVPPVPAAPQVPAVAPVPPVPPVPAVPPVDEEAALGARAAELGRREAELAQREAELARRSGEDMRRVAIKSALASLRHTRAALSANRDMPAAARRQALAEVDAALVEVQAEAASAD